MLHNKESKRREEITMQDLILVLNYADRPCRNVTRKLRAEQVNSVVLHSSVTLEEIQKVDPKGIVLAGSADGRDDIVFDTRILQSGVPILALGDPALTMLTLLGGKVGPVSDVKGLVSFRFEHHVLNDGIADQERMVGTIRTLEMAGCMQVLCTGEGEVLGFMHELMPVIGMQFELEQNDPDGALMLKNFAVSLCGCSTQRDDDAVLRECQEKIRMLCPEKKAICALTGGLDSAVSALISARAIGFENVKCYFIDTGFLRENESTAFLKCFRDQMGLDITFLPAAERFMDAVAGIMDSEGKKKAIGDLLIRILTEEIEKCPDIGLVIRGTALGDRMQNTVAPLPEGIDLPEFAPVDQLFKEEIRRIGEKLGIPPEYVTVQSFPGTGLALRVRGCVTRERLETLRRADAILNEELREAGVRRLMKSFAALLPDSADLSRSIICLRAVQSSESNYAFASRLPYDVLERVTARLMVERKDVYRVMYDLTSAGSDKDVEYV